MEKQSTIKTAVPTLIGRVSDRAPSVRPAVAMHPVSERDEGRKAGTLVVPDARVHMVKVNTEWQGLVGAQRPHHYRRCGPEARTKPY